MNKRQLSNIQCHADIKSCHAELVSASRNRFRNKFGMTLLLILFSILFFSCENAVDAAYDNYIEESQTDSSSKKAYIVFNLVENGRSAARTVTGTTGLPKQGISTGVTSSLFSDITFSGSRSDGVTLAPVTASSFAQLSGRSIEVEAGSWTFELEAWLGKTSTNPGEKYFATQALTVAPGANQLTMSLVPDSASTATAAAQAAHPGSWQIQVKFPCNDENLIDQVDVWLLKYSDFASAGSNLSSVVKQFEHTYVKGTDFNATGQQTLNVGEASRACGNYIVYVRFLKNVIQQGGTSASASVTATEVINTWGELMRINPGASASGIITLPNADTVYTITYDTGNAEWDTSATDNIQISYTRNSGTSGVITLPGESAFVNRNPSSFTATDPARPYQFLGWYDNPQFTGTAKTSFQVTDAENKTFYAKWKVPIFDVYISSSGHDDTGDGSIDNPLKTAKAAYALFGDLGATNSDNTYKNTIHILSNYTGTNKIDQPWGDGSKNGMYVNFVGEKGGVANTPVTLELDVSQCPDSNGNLTAQTFIYLENNQRMKFKNINFTSSQTYEHPNGYGCLFSTAGTEIIFEDSTITGYVAKGCCGINVDGVAWLKNCEISGNYAIDANNNPDDPWGSAVNVGNGSLHIEGSVIIKNNHILNTDGTPASENYNLYLGTWSGTPATLHFMPMVVHNSIAGSEIWLKLAQEPRAFTSGYGTQTGAPADYFHSDSGLDVELNATGEAALSLKIYLYVNSNSESPAGNDSSGNGSQNAPYASIGKAIEKITSFNNNLMDAIIYVKGDVPCNTIIDDDGTTTNESGVTAGKQLIAQTLKIEGVGSTATAVLNGNTSARVLDSRTTVPLTLKNLTIKNGQTTSRGGGLYIDGTTVEINNCIIENNSAYSQGGGVYLTNGARLTMNGQSSVIRSNWLTGVLPVSTTVTTNKCGGGVYIDSGTTFTMNAGTIEGNGAYSGGGVYVRGSFEMNGDTDTTVIQSNMRIAMGNTPDSTVLSSTQLTANVEVGIPGTFTMNGGKITSSLSQGQNGAGVCVYASHGNGDENGTATFNMTGGEISGLNISQTAAVYLLAAPNGSSENFSLVFNMSGGKITGNTAIVGTYSEYGTCAGVYVGRYGAFNMTGGEISHNHARIKAGGVYRENITGTGLIVPTITLGQTSSASTILIKDNTVGSPAVTGNIYLDEGKTVTVAGALSTASEVGITRAGAFSASPFTSGFASHNGGAAPTGTSPADIFTSDEGYTIIAGSGGEAAFLTSSASGTVYAPGDYHFTLAASRSSVTLGRAATVTITPDITRTEPNGNTTPLFYNPSDHKLYLDSAFTQPEGSGSTVTWSASLWCHGSPEYDSLTAVTGTANTNKFTIPALTFEDTYTLNVTATYQGYTHNANLPLQCESASALSIPLTLEAVNSAATVTFKNKASGPVIYKVNGGEEQTIAANTNGTITLDAAGDKVEFFGDNATYGGSGGSDTCTQIKCSKACYVYGNIMSLVNSTAYETTNTLTDDNTFRYLFYYGGIRNKAGYDLLLPATTLTKSCYSGMFWHCSGLTTAPELPATTLTNYCYSSMFNECTNLTEVPILSATTLANYCYSSMFSGCTSLVTAPSLPSTTLANSCYDSMFMNCTSLTTAPELPATNLARSCYYSMFYGCTSLVTAPSLPSTTLANSCYDSMFMNCTSLTTAPVLPAASTLNGNYTSMFKGCTNLSSVTCLATYIGTSVCSQWLEGVSATGIFTKAAGVTWSSGTSGIPNGWTVQDAP